VVVAEAQAVRGEELVVPVALAGVAQEVQEERVQEVMVLPILVVALVVADLQAPNQLAVLVAPAS
jgi:hypothetical protein